MHIAPHIHNDMHKTYARNLVNEVSTYDLEVVNWIYYFWYSCKL